MINITITKANKNLKQVDVSKDEELKDVELTLKFINAKLGERLYWCGDFVDETETITCAGENCLPIKSNVDLAAPE